MNKIIVIFKTHLDIGFTSEARNVVANYMENYLPNAMKVAREMRGEKQNFIWTTGSWLIQKYLEEGTDKATLEDAILHGEIRWHGLPFTTHTEQMDKELFCYGLNISKSLDECFGMKTIAAKLTDVPGHTKSIIPYMYEAGLRFLHIGVNPASTRPSVPDLFRWRADSGEEIVVMYNGDYGVMTEIGNSGAAVYFAHTGDNLGPQSAEQIREIFKKLEEEHPEADVVSGTLEDVAEIAMNENLPVINEEIADTWIHGTACDCGKVSQYKALLRLKDQLSKEDMEKMYKELVVVPEHTWGRDEKITLGRPPEEVALYDFKGEHNYFVRTEFEAVRGTEKFQRMEGSWQEQRDYVNRAVESLSGESRKLAEEAVSQYKREIISVEDGFAQKNIGEMLEIGSWKVRVNEFGEIDYLAKGECVAADSEHVLGSFVYEVFSQNEYDRFRKQYVISEEKWAIEDFGKIGVDKAIKEHKVFRPQDCALWQKGDSLLIRWKLADEATALFGGMKLCEMKVDFEEKGLNFDLAWFGKKASRIPEGVWLGFMPKDTITCLQKTGGMIDPLRVIENGNRQMHAVEKVFFEHAQLESVDAPLVSLGGMHLVEHTNVLPNLEKGLYVNLLNNTWGTNFVMWYDEDARFRIHIEL